jgi:hypothetical protein
MDVVPSTSNPTELYVYAINHRRPVQGSGKKVGANSVVEIFKTTIGGNTLTHLKTVEDPVIDTPNDLVGSSDGKSFYFTNDHGVKMGVVSGPHLEVIVAPRSFIPCPVQALRVLRFVKDFRRVLPYR